MTLSLTPAERVLRSRLAAHALPARYSGLEITRAARAASPGPNDCWLCQVDTDQHTPGQKLDKERESQVVVFSQLLTGENTYLSSRT